MEEILEKVQIKKYPAYKDSAIEWLGEIPEHWEIVRGNYVFKIINERSKKGTEELLSVSEHHGVRPRSESNVNMFMAESYEGYKMCYPGDLVINSLWAWSRGLGVSKYKGIVSTAYSVYRPDHSNYDKDFLNYLLRIENYVAQYLIASKGIWISRLLLSDWSFLRLPILTPPKEEQTRIAQFLDQKTAQIEKAINIKEKQIELLKERRQILIHNAVTRGLYPNAPLKDSGVDWIGEIPAHWSIGKVKQYSIKISKGTTPSTEGRTILDEGPIRFIKAENIQDGNITDTPGHFIDEKTNSIIRRSQLKENDVLFVIAGATLGKVAIVNKENTPSNTNQAVAFIRPTSKVIPQYLAIWLTTKIIKELIWLDAVQSAQPNLSMEDLGNFPIILPELEEQKSLLNYLENLNNKVSTAISIIEKEIEKLKEYKATLINSAVTGKIKVS